MSQNKAAAEEGQPGEGRYERVFSCVGSLFKEQSDRGLLVVVSLRQLLKWDYVKFTEIDSYFVVLKTSVPCACAAHIDRSLEEEREGAWLTSHLFGWELLPFYRLEGGR